MVKDVLINIKGIQGIDGESGTIELVTEGKFGIRDGEYYLTYDETTTFDSDEKTKTRIYVKNADSVVLSRTGAVSSQMLIENGRRNTCIYATPFGEMTIGISGECIEHSLSENGGEIKLVYSIDSQLRLISRNEVNISVREV